MNFSVYFHPLFFSVYPVIYLYSQCLGTVHYSDAIFPALASMAVAFVGLLFFRFATGDGGKSSLIVTLGCFGIFAYGPFDSSMALTEGFGAVRTLWFPLLWFFVHAAGIAHIFKSRYSLLKACTFLNLVAMVLLLMVSGTILHHNVLNSRMNQSDHSEPVSLIADSMPAGRQLPDIYYVIFDGYGRQDNLKRIFNHDNFEFLNFLSDSGFFVASESFANYPQTYLSLSSSLNYSYLDSLKEKYSGQNSVQPLIEMIQDNRLIKKLREYGYKSVAFSSGYSGTEIRTADVYFSRSVFGREFLDTLINMTFLAALKLPFFDMSISQADIHRERVRQTMRDLVALKLHTPTFVFSHIISPHPPFVFDAEGNPVNVMERFTLWDGSHWGSDQDLYRRLYKDQLVYLNTLMKEMVAGLIKKDNRPKIVILQSDHGPGSGLNWQDIDKTDLKERFGILNAIYFSDGDQTGLYPGMTPVNTFRVILNRITGEKLELLPDRSFFAPWFGRYRFVEVTEKLH